MDPVAESQRLYGWQDMDIPAEASADPSLWRLRESLLRMDRLFRSQSEDTQSLLRQEADRIAAVLAAGKAPIRFHLPGTVVLAEAREREGGAVDIPKEFREQRIAGFLNRYPAKDARSALRSRLSRLENSGYFGVQTAAGLMRYAVARQILLRVRPEKPAAGLPEGTDSGMEIFSPDDADWLRSCAAPEDPGETQILRDAESAIFRLREGITALHQAVSLAPYMYADEEYQTKRVALLNRSVSLGYALARREVRGMIRTIWRRALANDLNRGLSLSVPFFDDRALEMRMHEFEVIPPGRTMFVPAFVVLAARREMERVGQMDFPSTSTRVHLLAALKGLEQAFDGRPR